MKLALISILILTMLLSLSSSHINAPVAYADHPSDRVLIQQEIGRPAICNGDYLAIDDKFYALPVFDANDSLISVNIIPWVDVPGCSAGRNYADKGISFTDIKFNDFLAHIKLVRSLGGLLQTGNEPFILNLRGTAYDQYEFGFIKRTMLYSAVDKHTTRKLVESFSVYFFHQVSGTLEEKEFLSSQNLYRVTVDGGDYLVTKQSFEELRLGKIGSLNVCGPIDEFK